MSRRLGWSRGVLALLLAGQLGACGSTPRVSYTASEAAAATVPGMDLSVRAYADASETTFTEMAARPENKKVPFAYLALSGGGGDGAYGAGILNGWTESGKRPEFSLVSGVSTGALIAPFAFVGPEYDAVLKDIYTSGVASTLVQSPSVANVLFGSGLFGDGRLRDLVRRYVTPDLLAAIATQHAKGRRLLVVTTNLDSQRAVIWNMGAIATNGGPTALDLFSDVLTASASIPAVFPPQLLDVQAEGRAFQEMHVDGSVVTPVFTLPQSFLLRDGRFKAGAKSDIYVIINGRLEPEFDLAQNNTLSIVERSFTTASRARSRATMATTYAFTRSNGIGFNLTYIDESAPNTTAARGFDTGYMRSLYESGFQAGRTGTFWRKNVPTAPLLKTVAEAR
ncbi:alpha/beta hydrolase [Methylobacterium sp. Leaf102]|uniref:patatin-like phospholipase family protein n=1 Tax=unclassified Methylobacterium TaxID=2615210 RepID=UPI0006FAE341|nr:MULTISPECIES: patatin-like phospholipase family protein [unclassified Methylobacterium]KQO69453.1 alpha/beta hydrolase [Methylobacterium sp. Leaf87]KQP34460.1 alpha/beta hydrolase [Methylobacterium sp. Leaf102]KQP36856.1 alpha/beta hydrolase [Methylobacterium sp. Leaf100]